MTIFVYRMETKPAVLLDVFATPRAGFIGGRVWSGFNVWHVATGRSSGSYAATPERALLRFSMYTDAELADAFAKYDHDWQLKQALK